MKVTIHDAIQLPLRRMALATSTAALVPGVLIAPFSPVLDILQTLSAAVVVALSALLGVAVLGAIGPRPATQVPPLLLANSLVRILASLAVALTLYMLLRPEPRWFWGAFLFASFTALFADTLVSLGIVRRLDGGAP